MNFGLQQYNLVINMRHIIIYTVVFFCMLSCTTNQQMIRDGDKIVKKIENYRSVNNKLPLSLEDIGVKETMEGPFFYKRKDSIYYMIWFGTYVGESMYYYSDTKEWDYRLRDLPKSKPIVDSKLDLKREVAQDIDTSISAELYAKEVLKESLRKHSYDATDGNKPKHIEIFENVGLENVTAYSNKNYPKNREPNYYEDFILFVATFDNEINANKTFDQIKSDSKYGLSEWRELENTKSERVQALNIGAKSGGLIFQSGKQIFSLVKTCRETPIGGTWNDYEKKFMRCFIQDSRKEFKVLRSKCGSDRYKYQTIQIEN